MNKIIRTLIIAIIFSLGFIYEAQAQTPDNKLSPSLDKILQDKKDNEKLKTGIWLHADLTEGKYNEKHYANFDSVIFIDKPAILFL